MPRVCTLCSHPKRNEIDKALLNDEPNQRIATAYKVTESAVRRHKAARHVALRMVKAQEREDVRHAIDVVMQLKAINGATLAVLKEARDDKNGDLALKAVDRIQRQLELQSKLLGELNDGTTINITVSTEWLELRALIVQAISPYPEAREAVVKALN